MKWRMRRITTAYCNRGSIKSRIKAAAKCTFHRSWRTTPSTLIEHSPSCFARTYPSASRSIALNTCNSVPRNRVTTNWTCLLWARPVCRLFGRSSRRYVQVACELCACGPRDRVHVQCRHVSTRRTAYIEQQRANRSCISRTGAEPDFAIPAGFRRLRYNRGQSSQETPTTEKWSRNIVECCVWWFPRTCRGTTGKTLSPLRQDVRDTGCDLRWRYLSWAKRRIYRARLSRCNWDVRDPDNRDRRTRSPGLRGLTKGISFNRSMRGSWRFLTALVSRRSLDHVEEATRKNSCTTDVSW